MLLANLLTLLTQAEQARDARRQRGFRVTWAWYDNTGTTRDHAPEKSETALATEADAWALAARIADLADFVGERAGRRLADIYVVDSDLVPVPGAEKRILRPWLGRIDDRVDETRESIVPAR